MEYIYQSEAVILVGDMTLRHNIFTETLSYHIQVDLPAYDLTEVATSSSISFSIAYVGSYAFSLCAYLASRQFQVGIRQTKY